MNPQADQAPLHGVRILDMATVLAAPFSATLCGDMGAEVVKLELPAGGDPLRGLTPVHEGHPLFWKTANRGKKGISLDVRKPSTTEQANIWHEVLENTPAAQNGCVDALVSQFNLSSGAIRASSCCA